MEKTLFYWSCVLIFLTADYTNEENEEKMKKKHFFGPVYPLNEINTPKKLVVFSAPYTKAFLALLLGLGWWALRQKKNPFFIPVHELVQLCEETIRVPVNL